MKVILLALFFAEFSKQADLSNHRLAQKFLDNGAKNLPTIDKYGNSYRIVHFWGRGNTDYTQGFKYKDNQILESTGMLRQSKLQYLKFDDKSNTLESHTVRHLTDRSDFGEGCDIIRLNDGKEYAFQ